MPFIQKALVAVDDSEPALHAFLEAITLDRRFGCRLLAVSVAPPYQGDLSLVGVKDLNAVFQEPVLTVLEEAVRIAVEEGIGLTTFKARGQRHEAIIDLAVRESCDLIVLGQDPRPKPTALGSLTAKLLKFSPIDLLVIPRYGELRFDRVLCSAYGHPVLRFGIRDKAAGGDADVCIHKGPLKSLPKAAMEMGADLIVVGGKESGGILDALTGGKVYRIVRSSRRPVWVLRN